jgi:hypothetical protein
MKVENQMVTDRPSWYVRSNGVNLSVMRSKDLPNWSTLIAAVNFYVSTSEAVGEGILEERKGTHCLIIPVNTSNPVDAHDLATLESRVSELPAEWDVKLERCEDFPPLLGMDFSYLHVPAKRVDEVSRALLEQPGALGWGSLVAQLTSYDDEDLASAVASLGLPFIPPPVHSELLRRTMRGVTSKLG